MVRALYPAFETIFRDSYTLDFPGLPPVHFEADLRKGIVGALKNFLIEFGRDFAFIGEEYRGLVGMKDFSIDLLFDHRELQWRSPHPLSIGGIGNNANNAVKHKFQLPSPRVERGRG